MEPAERLNPFGAAIEMLANAIRACPDELWAPRTPGGRPAPVWRMAYHTLFYLDKYLADDPEAFAPPAPFDPSLRRLEPDPPQGERPYTKPEMLAYLEHCARRCRAEVGATTGERARRACGLPWLPITRAELHLYNLRHVQHHAAQLSLLLRQATDAAPDWVSVSSRRVGEPA
jgi:uncharacterized damage-inducible protein DinB